MIERTIKKTVTFANPFVLGDFEEVLPPGSYEVETDEELLQGLSFHAYRTVLTVVHLPANFRHGGSGGMLTIAPGELDAALLRDKATTRASAERAANHHDPSWGSPKTREVETDRRAVDRAENEGMIVQPQ